MCSAIFIADVTFGIGAISLLYVLYMLSSYFFSDKSYQIVATVAISICLTLIGWLFQSSETLREIDLGYFYTVINYEGVFRVASCFVLLFLGGVLVKHKNKEFELEKLNESLELRILAKTAASENRAKILEMQISVLQKIRQNQENESMKRLDIVINQLKELNNLEFSDA